MKFGVELTVGVGFEISAWQLYWMRAYHVIL
jgi:hypothetical protein